MSAILFIGAGGQIRTDTVGILSTFSLTCWNTPAMVYATISNYTTEELLVKIKKVYSIAGLLRELGLRPAGGNYDTMRNLLKYLNADTSHWTGQGWSLGHQHKDLENYTRPASVKIHVINEQGYNCRDCGISEWRDKDLTLELEHIDGDRFNHEMSNLCLLCPNCHSQTKSWRGRNNKR